MDNPEARKIVQPSAGIHIVLPEYYSPRNMGLLDPSTSDGRVIFFLPWQGVCTRVSSSVHTNLCYRISGKFSLGFYVRSEMKQLRRLALNMRLYPWQHTICQVQSINNTYQKCELKLWVAKVIKLSKSYRMFESL